MMSSESRPGFIPEKSGKFSKEEILRTEQTRPSPEDADAVETLAYNDLERKVQEQMIKIERVLGHEKELAAFFEARGAKVTRESAEKIVRLETLKNDLASMEKNVLLPHFEEAWKTTTEGTTFFLAKPEELTQIAQRFESIITGMEEVTDDMIVSSQTENELVLKEQELQEEAEVVEGELVTLSQTFGKQDIILQSALARVGQNKELLKEIAVVQTKTHLAVLEHLTRVGEDLREIRVMLRLKKIPSPPKTTEIRLADAA